MVKINFQLNQLHLRRAKAASAAASIAQIQKINSGQIKSEKDSKTMMPMNGTMASHPTKFSHVPAPSQPRPKASVEPFHVQV